MIVAPLLLSCIRKLNKKPLCQDLSPGRAIGESAEIAPSIRA